MHTPKNQHTTTKLLDETTLSNIAILLIFIDVSFFL